MAGPEPCSVEDKMCLDAAAGTTREVGLVFPGPDVPACPIAIAMPAIASNTLDLGWPVFIGTAFGEPLAADGIAFPARTVVTIDDKVLLD